MTRIILALAAVSLLSGQAAAASCKVQASEKKLSGAAMESFTKKCESDAKAACEKASGEKKLSGAAKTSYEKKCLTEATGKP